MMQFLIFVTIILLFATYIVSKGSASVKILRDAGVLDEGKDIKRLKRLFIRSALIGIVPAISGTVLFNDLNYPDLCVFGSIFILFSAAFLYIIPFAEETRLRMFNFGEKKEAEIVDFKSRQYDNIIEYLPENNIDTHRIHMAHIDFGHFFSKVQFKVGDKITIFSDPKNEKRSILYTPKLWNNYYLRKQD
ncbi:MAG: hypothetical protein ACTHOO_01700 [Alcanivorax sp.]